MPGDSAAEQDCSPRNVGCFTASLAGTFRLSVAADSLWHCSHCLCSHSLMEGKCSSVGKCLVQTFRSRQAQKLPRSGSFLKGMVREGSTAQALLPKGDGVVPLSRALVAKSASATVATSGSGWAITSCRNWRDSCCSLMISA